MSRKVNNLRKRMRQQDQEKAKQARDIEQREAACREIEQRLKQRVDDGLVAIVVKRLNGVRFAGNPYAFQMIVDFDMLSYFFFRDQSDIRDVYPIMQTVERELVRQLRILFNDILKSQDPMRRRPCTESK